MYYSINEAVLNQLNTAFGGFFDPARIKLRSTRENVTSAFADLAKRVKVNDEIIVLPAGHTFMMNDRRVHAAIMRALDPDAA